MKRTALLNNSRRILRLQRHTKRKQLLASAFGFFSPVTESMKPKKNALFPDPGWIYTLEKGSVVQRKSNR